MADGKKTRFVFPILFGITFHVGADKDHRRRVSFEEFRNKTRWRMDDKGRFVLVFRCGEDMHILGAVRDEGEAVSLEVPEGDYVVIDPLEGTIEVVRFVRYVYLLPVKVGDTPPSFTHSSGYKGEGYKGEGCEDSTTRINGRGMSADSKGCE